MYLALAILLARLGLRVIPCHPDSKVPCPKGGWRIGTSDIELLRKWWKIWPNAIIGLSGGYGIGLIDIDSQQKLENFQKFEECVGVPFPWLTATQERHDVSTGFKRMHMIVRYDRNRGAMPTSYKHRISGYDVPIKEDFEIKGYCGGCIIEGNNYKWLLDQELTNPVNNICMLPDAWQDALMGVHGQRTTHANCRVSAIIPPIPEDNYKHLPWRTKVSKLTFNSLVKELRHNFPITPGCRWVQTSAAVMSVMGRRYHPAYTKAVVLCYLADQDYRSSVEEATCDLDRIINMTLMNLISGKVSFGRDGGHIPDHQLTEYEISCIQDLSSHGQHATHTNCRVSAIFLSALVGIMRYQLERGDDITAIKITTGQVQEQMARIGVGVISASNRDSFYKCMDRFTTRDAKKAKVLSVMSRVSKGYVRGPTRVPSVFDMTVLASLLTPVKSEEADAATNVPGSETRQESKGEAMSLQSIYAGVVELIKPPFACLPLEIQREEDEGIWYESAMFKLTKNDSIGHGGKPEFLHAFHMEATVWFNEEEQEFVINTGSDSDLDLPNLGDPTYFPHLVDGLMRDYDAWVQAYLEHPEQTCRYYSPSEWNKEWLQVELAVQQMRLAYPNDEAWRE